MSDWPHSLLLDELWLRSRRLAVRRLERGGFWTDSAQYWPALETLITLGRALEQRCLAPRLSAAEYAYLHSEQAFGAARKAMGRRAPLVMAFGHQVTALFAACGGRPEPGAADAAADAGAGFNLGIALIDLLLDEPALKRSAAVVLDVLNEHDVRKLLLPQYWAAFDEALVRVPLGDARVVLRVVGAVYQGIARLEMSPQRVAELGVLLEQALLAEIASTGASGHHQTPAAKSTLPFEVLACIARAAAPPSSSGDEVHRELARQFGAAIAQLDDLSDLVDDLRSGAVNSICARPAPAARMADGGAVAVADGDFVAGGLVESGLVKNGLVDGDFANDGTADGRRGVDDGVGAATALALLEGDALELAADALLAHLQQAETLALSLASADSRSLVMSRLASTRHFVRNWLE